MTNCIYCGHELDRHYVIQYGQGEYHKHRIDCAEQGDDVHDTCGCNAGFEPISIKFHVERVEEKENEKS